mmetsp:Transcript_46717/g.77318  ORF Transcript_46717/g.77318 Transcript_46717/m.77318 type:complete len:207 (+) Transcript_46717:256-876(+)
MLPFIRIINDDVVEIATKTPTQNPVPVLFRPHINSFHAFVVTDLMMIVGILSADLLIQLTVTVSHTAGQVAARLAVTHLKRQLGEHRCHLFKPRSSRRPSCTVIVLEREGGVRLRQDRIISIISRPPTMGVEEVPRVVAVILETQPDVSIRLSFIPARGLWYTACEAQNCVVLHCAAVFQDANDQFFRHFGQCRSAVNCKSGYTVQ